MNNLLKLFTPLFLSLMLNDTFALLSEIKWDNESDNIIQIEYSVDGHDQGRTKHIIIPARSSINISHRIFGHNLFTHITNVTAFRQAPQNMHTMLAQIEIGKMSVSQLGAWVNVGSTISSHRNFGNSTSIAVTISQDFVISYNNIGADGAEAISGYTVEEPDDAPARDMPARHMQQSYTVIEENNNYIVAEPDSD